jgi:hypothetical protein
MALAKQTPRRAKATRHKNLLNSRKARTRKDDPCQRPLFLKLWVWQYQNNHQLHRKIPPSGRELNPIKQPESSDQECSDFCEDVINSITIACTKERKNFTDNAGKLYPSCRCNIVNRSKNYRLKMQAPVTATTEGGVKYGCSIDRATLTSFEIQMLPTKSKNNYGKA